MKAGKSACIDVQKPHAKLLVRPKGNTSYSDTASIFTVLSEYSFNASDKMMLTLSFEKAKADIDTAFHTFRRVSLKGFDCPFDVSFRVIPPNKIKKGISGFFWELLANFFLDVGLPVLFGLIVWANTDSVVKSLIAAAVTLALLTVITLGTEKLFDKRHDRRRKRRGLPSEKEPIGLNQCLDPGYIDCMFKKAGF